MSKYDELILTLCPNGVEHKKVSDICDISRGQVMSKDYIKQNAGEYPVYSSQTENSGELGKISTYMFDGEYLTWTTDGANAGTVFYRTGKFSVTNVCGLLKVNANTVLVKYLYYALSIEAPKYVVSGMGNPKLMSNVMGKIKVPVPPVKVQSEIVRILDNFTELTVELTMELTAELTARKKQYDYYTEQLMNFGENVKRLTLGEIGSVKMCKRILKEQTNTTGGIPFYKIGTFGKTPDAYISEELFDEYRAKYSYPKKGDILISCSGTIGRTVVFDGEPAYFQDSNIVWLEHDGTIVNNKYLLYCYKKQPWQISTGGTIARLYNDNILKAKIPVPPIEEQKRIVDILERFDALYDDIFAGLPVEIEARQKQYEYYRDKLLTFEPAQSKEII